MSINIKVGSRGEDGRGVITIGEQAPAELELVY